MEVAICDACAHDIACDEQRFVIKIEVYAPFEGLEVDVADLVATDYESELKRVGQALADVDPEEAQDDVHRAFRYILCRPCQRDYLQNPLRPGWGIDA